MQEHPQVSDFIAYLRLKNLSPRTIALYRDALTKLFEHVGLGRSAPGQITTAQLREHVTSLLDRGLAPKTVSNRVLAIKRFFGFLLAEGCIQHDPSRGIPLPKVPRRLPKALTVPEVRALFSAMGDGTRAERRDQIFFKLVYACGLRIGEAIRARVEDIDWEQGWLRVIGKGDKERRVYLKPYLVAGLRDYVEENGLKGYLFPGRTDHMSVSGISARLKRYVRKAGLPDEVSPHTLRHSVAVHYLMAGAPITFVQSLLGHESPSTGSGQAWRRQASTRSWLTRRSGTSR